MKKIILISVLTLVVTSFTLFSQNAENKTDKKSNVVSESKETLDLPADSESEIGLSGNRMLKKYFIDGGDFMFPILLCFIFGLAIIIEKIISLNLKSINSKKLLAKLEDLFRKNQTEAAEDLCRNTRGVVASICYQALMRRNEGVEGVEKSIISYGSVQMSLLEKGLVWISLFISIAPMLGFLGTVIGMVQAFDSIEQAGSISPSLLAGGIKVALLTTVGGLIVAIVLQVFYNYLVSKIDNLVLDMEDSSISLVDMMIAYGVTAKKE